MDGKTHMAAGYSAGALLLLAQLNGTAGLPEPEGLLPSLGVIGLAVAGALAPDIDLPYSKAGRHNRSASVLVNLFFGHRTVTHAPLIWLVLYAVLLKVLGRAWFIYVLAFVIGGGTHILLDLCNAAGVPLLWPLSFRFHILKIRADSFFGRIFSYCFFGAAVVCTVCLLRQAENFV